MCVVQTSYYAARELWYPSPPSLSLRRVLATASWIITAGQTSETGSAILVSLHSVRISLHPVLNVSR